MSKNIDVDTLNHFIAALARPVILLKLEYDSTTIGINSTLSTISFDSVDYLGVGNLGSLSTIEENSELSAAGIQATLSGVDPANISIALSEYYQGNLATIYLGGLEEDCRTLVGDPMILFEGRMDNQVINLGESASITLRIENLQADWNRANVKRYNNETQQKLYPGDRFLEFAEQSVEKKIFWGK